MRHPSRWSQLIVVLGLTMLLMYTGARAQLTQLSFSTPYNVSNNSDYSATPQVAVDAAGHIYVAWEDDAANNANILVSRSTDGGATFLAPVNISSAVSQSTSWPYNPRLAVESGGAIDVVWLDSTSRTYDVFFARSTDGGKTFSAPLNLSNDNADNAEPQIAVDANGKIHVVWENDSITFGVFYTQSSDGGATFSPVTPLVPGGTSAATPELAVAGSNVYVAWENDASSHSQVAFSHSSDGGATFSPATNLTNTAGSAFGAKLAVDAGGNLDVVWIDNPAGNYELMFSRSTDNGATFSAAIDVSNNPGDAGDPQLATDANGNISIVWRENTPPDFNRDIYFVRSSDAGVTFSSPVNLSNNFGNSNAPWLNLDAAGNINVSWEDTTPGTSQILFTQSTDSGVTFSPAQNVSHDTGSATGVQVGSDMNSNLNLIWTDNASGVSQVLYSRHSAPQKANQPPVANAGGDQVLHATGPTTPATLDGSLSSDPDGDALTFVWTEGTTVVGNTAVVQLNLSLGAHTFTLTVTDPAGLSSSADTHVTINDQAPLANAGPDQTLPAAGTTTPVTLNGSASIDPDNDPLTFVWTEGTTVVGTSAVVNLNVSVGLHTFTLTVKDPAGLSSTAVIHVTITKPDQPPVAKVGPDQTISCAPRSGVLVTLDGSQSSDPDGDTLGFLWTDETNKIVGTSAVVQLTVPPGTHAYTLTVGDAGGLSSTATTHVTVASANPPTLSVSLSPNVLWPPNHKMVQINATINISDACDANPAVKLVSVVRSDGNTGDNVQAVGGGPVPFGTDVRSFLVRSENSDTGGDLVYTVTYCVTDGLGNSTNASAQVLVSHNPTSGTAQPRRR